MTFIQYDHGPDKQDWFYNLAKSLRDTTPIHTREWQSQDTSASPVHATRELMNVRINREISSTPAEWVSDIKPNMPWAEEHFLERVSGIPHNPPPSHVRWPWGRATANAAHTDPSTGRFSHTYPERLWSKHAGDCHGPYGWSPAGLDGEHGDMVALDRYGHDGEDQVCPGHRGIRERYGDLDDVIALLVRSPLTRQAYIPIWFPEDTGNHANVRVPCTLGYHLMIRNDRMHCWYAMRSCDLIRHLRDDVYMAGRLVQCMCDQVNAGMASTSQGTPDIIPGMLNMTISSLHAFVGDDWRLDKLSRGDES